MHLQNNCLQRCVLTFIYSFSDVLSINRDFSLSGKITLFVVNHCPEEDRIEKFEFNKEKMMLEHKMSYRDEAINL
jgi:hypothetical protein